MTRVIALDVGSVRIGVAASDALGITAQALETLQRKGEQRDIARLKELAAARQAAGFVVGLPRNMDGSEGPQAQETRAFARKLSGATGLPICFIDERLTTRSAHRALLEGDMRRANRKKVVDQVAAVLILQAYLENPRPWDEGKEGVE